MFEVFFGEQGEARSIEARYEARQGEVCILGVAVGEVVGCGLGMLANLLIHADDHPSRYSSSRWRSGVFFPVSQGWFPSMIVRWETGGEETRSLMATGGGEAAGQAGDGVRLADRSGPDERAWRQPEML